MRAFVLLLGTAIAFGFFTGCPAAEKSDRAKHVVLIVWDGLRPDLVTEQNAPNLWKLAQEGVMFRNHHSAFPSATNVNGTVMATGVFPSRSSLIANTEFRPQIDPEAPVDSADAERVRQGDELSDGKYLLAPTIAELLHGSGKRTAVAGTKWVSALFDRAPHRPSPAAQDSPTVTAGKATPSAVDRMLRDSLGEFPAKAMPNAGQDEWTTAALTRFFWKEEVPAFSLLWLSDPDFTQHDTAPGHPSALAGIKSSDRCLGKVVDALKTKGALKQTDILVVSDHGFSTVERSVDVPALLRADGFKATKKFQGKPEAGSILVVGNGGSVLFYVTDRDEEVTRRLVAWLQQSDFAGVIFAHEKMEGAFSMADIHLEKESGPDVVMAFRWNAQPNEFGVAGMIMADWNRGPGKGTHVTLSKFDLHNTLIAAGPDFRRGFQSESPSGNIDIAPTILHILEVIPSVPLDGRVLTEAMLPVPRDIPLAQTETMEARRDPSSGGWGQYLKISKIGDYRYIDEGNRLDDTAESRQVR